MKKWLLASAVIVAVLLHQDFWFWKDKTLLLGFLPVGLAYHMGYSVLASLTLWLLVKFAWPAAPDEPEKPER